MKRLKLIVPLAAFAIWSGASQVARSVVSPPTQQWQTIEASMDVPPAVSGILKRACRNCHSHDTELPWFASLPPARWLAERDIQKARQAMNLSTWATGPGRNPGVAAATLAAACADVRSQRMPLAAYAFMHPESRLSKADQQMFCNWANRSSRELLSRRGPAAP